MNKFIRERERNNEPLDLVPPGRRGGIRGRLSVVFRAFHRRQRGERARNEPFRRPTERSPGGGHRRRHRRRQGPKKKSCQSNFSAVGGGGPAPLRRRYTTRVGKTS